MKVKKKIMFDWWECEIEIDRSPETTNFMEAALLFWSGGQSRIDAAQGDIEKAFLIFIAQTILNLSTRYNLHGILEEISEAEGYFPLDGSHGIKVLSADEWEWMKEDFSVSDSPTA